MHHHDRDRTIADTYYQRALVLEQAYKASLEPYYAAEARYSKEYSKYERSFDPDRGPGYGSGPDRSELAAAERVKDSTWSQFVDALRNGATHGSKDAAIKLTDYGLPLKVELTKFGLEDKAAIAKALYERGIILKNDYLDKQDKWHKAYAAHSEDCRISSEEDNYGYHGSGHKIPDAGPSDAAHKRMEEAQKLYVAKMQEAAKYGSAEAIKELISNNHPIEPPKGFWKTLFN